MTRGLDAAQLAAAAATHRVCVQLFEMFFVSGTLRFTTCPWDITVGADVYASIIAVRVKETEESATSIEGIEFECDGINAAFHAIATQEPNQGRGRLVRVLKAYLNPDTHAVIGSPRVFNVYRIRQMPITELNNEVSIRVIAEHYDAELGRASPRRLNDPDQQRDYAGDLGCQYAEQMVEKVLVWPSREAFKT